MKLEQDNFHKRDSCIEFEEEPHIYYVNGSAYDCSVTGFVHSFFSKFEAEKIIEKFYYRWQANENSPYYGMSPQDILDMWEENRVLQASLGTILHNSIELFYNGCDVYNDTKEFGMFLEFFKEHKIFTPFRTEWMVYDEELRLAGSIDMCYMNEDGTVSLYDWKRSKEIKEQNKFQCGLYPVSHLPDCNYWHYSLQLNIYKYFLEKNYGLVVRDMFLVVFHPDNDSYLKIKVGDLQREVEDMFRVRRENRE